MRTILRIILLALTIGTAHAQQRGSVSSPFPLVPSNNLSDLVSAATARTNLGLGTLALQSTGQLVSNPFFSAQAYGTCTWSSSGDVGPCINLAIAAAAAAGGGKVLIPAGTFGLATKIINTTSGVGLYGQGVGAPRDGQNPETFQAITRLLWNGAANATMADIEPATLSAESLYKADVAGIVFDCNAVAGIGVKIAQVSNSVFDVGGAECQSINVYFTTTTASDSPGLQGNDIWAQSRSTNVSSAYKATGILIDGEPGSNWNPSFNRFHRLFAWYAKGDGIVFGSADNNIIEHMATQPEPSIGYGSPVVIAGQNYTQPNGMTTLAAPSSNYFIDVSTQVRETGFTSGSTISPISNAGTGAPATITITTNAVGPVNNGTSLPVASDASLTVGETVNCGTGTNSGVLPGNTIIALPTSTQVQLNGGLVGTIASGTSCKVTYGINSTAAVGTYTLTAVSATSFNLTAPTGGNSQTGVALANGTLAFTDMVIPWTGTAVANDTWSIVINPPAQINSIKFIDKANSIVNPMFEPGATGDFATSANAYPSIAGGNGIYIGLGQTPTGAASNGGFAVGTGAIAGGLGATAFGDALSSAPFSFSYGLGVGNYSTGGFAGGHNINNSGFNFYNFSVGENIVNAANDNFCVGESLYCGGAYSIVTGNEATDRGDTAQAFSTADFSTQGDQQARRTIISVALSSTSATPLTVGGGTASATNSLRTPTNTVQGLVLDQVACVDTSNRSNFAKWKRKDGVINRLSSTPAYTGDASTAVAADYSGGNASSATLMIAADTINDVPKIAVSWPNSDAVHCVGDLRMLEVQ